MTEAKKSGWNVIIMKNDWKRIFTWEKLGAHCDLWSFP
jgi:hypothetical protein